MYFDKIMGKYQSKMCVTCNTVIATDTQCSYHNGRFICELENETQKQIKSGKERRCLEFL